MSIEEIIDGLDKLAKKHEVCANCQDLKPIAPVYLKTAQLLRAAIEKLKTNQDNHPNNPLTLDELLVMEGKPHPVWCDKENAYVFIAAVKKEPYNQVWFFNYKGGCDTVLYYHTNFYRRHPKEETA